MRGPNVVVVSERFWKDKLGSCHEALGSVIQIDYAQFEVIGVAPESFRGTQID